MSMLEVSHQHTPWGRWLSLECSARQEHHFQNAELTDPLYHSWLFLRNLCSKKCKNTVLLEVKSELLFIHCAFVRIKQSAINFWWFEKWQEWKLRQSPLQSGDQVTYRDDNNTVQLLSRNDTSFVSDWVGFFDKLLITYKLSLISYLISYQNQLLPRGTFTFSLNW